MKPTEGITESAIRRSTGRGVVVADTLERAEQTFTCAAQAAAQPGTAAPSWGPARGARSVLIVEDELRIAEVIAEVLREDGHDVALAVDGEHGLAHLAERRADLVFADLVMPVMDGLAMIRRMRGDPRLAAIPTVLMTALADAVPTGDAALHDAVLIKPFGIIEVLAVMERLLPPR